MSPKKRKKMSPEDKILKKKKKTLREKKNLPVEVNGESNSDFDSTQQETRAKKINKSELDSKMKKKRNREDLRERQTLEKTKMKKKKKKTKGSEVDSKDADGIECEDLDGDRKGPAKEKKNKLGLKRKRRWEIENDVDASNEDQVHGYEHAAGNRPKSDHAKSSTQFETLKEDGNSEKPTRARNVTKIKTKKSKKEMKQKKKDFIAEAEQTRDLVDDGNVEEISSVDEDCSRGMKKWLIKYKESRPGLHILQERIDDFITAYEEQQEQERKEREARAAEGGWTVVVHHKGRKKTTEAETGVTVGSVAQAAVVDKMSIKKSKEVPLDFYRFKKREAQRNEIMMQQSKFEQDKKRIQQLRSARKFRPY